MTVSAGRFLEKAKGVWRSVPLRHMTALFIISVLALVTYFGVWQHGFLDYDDDIHLLKNPYLLSGNIAAFWQAPYYGLYVPVAYSFWTIITMMSGGPSATVLHTVNLIFHVINGFILYHVILKLLAKSPRPTTGTPPQTAALLATLLFVLHPLQVEPVAWISGFRDLIGAFFTLGAFALSISSWAPWAALCCFLLAILAKPTSCFLPAAIAVFFLWHEKIPAKKIVRSLWLWFVAAGMLVLFEHSIQMEGFDPRIVHMSPLQKIYVAADAMGFYLTKTVWPWSLTVDYGRLPEHLPASAPLFAMITAALVALTVLLRRHLTSVTLCALIFAGLALLTVSGIVPFAHQQISTVADRYAYVPLAAMAMAIAPLLMRFRQRHVVIVLSVAVTLLATLSHHRLAIWQDNRTFFGDMLRNNPASFNAHIGLGVDELNQKDYTAALNHFEQAISLKPHNVTALANLGICLFNLGRYQEILQRIEPWLPDSRFIAEVPLSAPEIAIMYLASGMAHMQLGRPQVAYQRLSVAAKIDPRNETVSQWKKNLEKN